MSIFFDFVDFLKPTPFNEKGALTGKLKICIKTLTPIFIGSGSEDTDGEMLFKSFQRCRGVPVIPGSTLKGVLRTVSQAVSYSCAEVSKAIQNDLPYFTGNCNCIVCKTYGKMGLKGVVEFGDMVLKEGSTSVIRIPLQMNPNVRKKDVYYRNDKLRGIKFYRHGEYKLLKNVQIPVEAVEDEGTFEGEIIFHDLHPEQLELICYSLGLDGSFQLKIGGNKSGFFGSCKVEVKGVLIDGKSFDTIQYACNYKKDDAVIIRNKQKLCEILSFSNKVTAI